MRVQNPAINPCACRSWLDWSCFSAEPLLSASPDLPLVVCPTMVNLGSTLQRGEGPDPLLGRAQAAALGPACFPGPAHFLAPRLLPSQPGPTGAGVPRFSQLRPAGASVPRPPPPPLPPPPPAGRTKRLLRLENTGAWPLVFNWQTEGSCGAAGEVAVMPAAGGAPHCGVLVRGWKRETLRSLPGRGGEHAMHGCGSLWLHSPLAPAIMPPAGSLAPGEVLVCRLSFRAGVQPALVDATIACTARVDESALAASGSFSPAATAASERRSLGGDAAAYHSDQSPPGQLPGSRVGSEEEMIAQHPERWGQRLPAGWGGTLGAAACDQQGVPHALIWL